MKRILIAPALLESTSVVFAYGIDLFLTRVAPSGSFDILSEDFNKMQLVLTIVGLAVAIVVTKPLVQRITRKMVPVDWVVICNYMELNTKTTRECQDHSVID